jgi:hypothetical protein
MMPVVTAPAGGVAAMVLRMAHAAGHRSVRPARGERAGGCNTENRRYQQAASE